MKVIVFGATGMLGQGAVRECLRDDRVSAVVSVGRSPSGTRHPKFTELVRPDLTDLADVEADLTGFDACLFCLGVSSAGMNEADYRRVTHDLTLAVATTLHRLNPDLRLLYISGAGTNSGGRTMWARVKGQTEDELLALLDGYMLRPGYIQPMHGATSRTRLYRVAYQVVAPLYPVLRRLAPHQVTTTETLARAMLAVAESGAPQRILGTREINALGA